MAKLLQNKSFNRPNLTLRSDKNDTISTLEKGIYLISLWMVGYIQLNFWRLEWCSDDREQIDRKCANLRPLASSTVEILLRQLSRFNFPNKNRYIQFKSISGQKCFNLATLCREMHLRLLNIFIYHGYSSSLLLLMMKMLMLPPPPQQLKTSNLLSHLSKLVHITQNRRNYWNEKNSETRTTRVRSLSAMTWRRVLKYQR